MKVQEIIEKIRAEVNRQRTYYNLNNPYDKRAIRVCNNILSTLGTLEKECVDFPTTDEEMKQFLATHPKVEVPEKYKTPDWMFDGLTPEEKMNHPLYLEGFEVGRKVGLVLAEKTTIPAEGFDREFSKFSNDVDAEHPFPICVDEYKDFARHFAKWGAEHRGSSEIPKDLDFEQELYKHFGQVKDFTLGMRIGKYFYNLCKEQTEKRWLEDRDGCFWDGVEEGKKAMKEQMMKEAVEGEVCGRVYDHINVRFADGVCKYLEPKNISHIPADVSKYNIGQKVKVIVVKED